MVAYGNQKDLLDRRRHPLKQLLRAVPGPKSPGGIRGSAGQLAGPFKRLPTGLSVCFRRFGTLGVYDSVNIPLQSLSRRGRAKELYALLWMSSE